jgi:serine/threonine-protein kinase RsbW
MPKIKNILIIDNEFATRKLIQDYLKNYLVETAANKDAALSLLNSSKFDLVITDVIIEGMSSLGLIDSIKAHNPDLPVVVTTSTRNIENALEAIKRGAINYVVKPNGLSNIQSIVTKALSTGEIFQRYLQTSKYIKTCFEIEIPSALQHIKGVIYYFMERTNLKDTESRNFKFPIQIALQEALLNSIIHGNKLNPQKKVYINAVLDLDRFEIKIRDEGSGFKFHALPNPKNELPDLKEHGRGIFLMRCYMDTVKFNDAGNEVYMVKNNPLKNNKTKNGNGTMSKRVANGKNHSKVFN